MVSRVPGELRFWCDLASNNEIPAAYLWRSRTANTSCWPVAIFLLCFEVERVNVTDRLLYETGPVTAFCHICSRRKGGRS